MRELAEEAGIAAPGALVQFGAYGDPGRDPRGNVVSVAFLAVGPRRPRARRRQRRRRRPPVARRRRRRRHGPAGLRPPPHRHRRPRPRRRPPAGTATSPPPSSAPSSRSASCAASTRRCGASRSTPPTSAAAWPSTPTPPTPCPLGSIAEPGPEGGRPPELYRATESWSAGSPVKRPRRRPTAAPDGRD